MKQISILRGGDDLSQIAEAWDHLRRLQSFYVPSFDDLACSLADKPNDFRIITLKTADKIISLACFVSEPAKKTFSIGERKLFSLPVRRVRLFGSAILGQPDICDAKLILQAVTSEFSFDLISLGEVPMDSTLYFAAQHAGSGLIATRASRKPSLRWSIQLPETFDQYWNSRSSKLRKSLRYQERKLLNELHSKLSITSQPEEVNSFLRDGESISRLTYQWNIGQRLCNDQATRERYHRLAEQGRLRCYIIYVAGAPVAFARGVITDTTYIFETPGFDPAYGKYSIGLVLLTWVIRDLVENTDCRLFDFGEGGDNHDYKSRFGSASAQCAAIELARWLQPYSLVIAILQTGLATAKNVASWMLGEGRLRARLKKAIRQYGTGNG